MQVDDVEGRPGQCRLQRPGEDLGVAGRSHCEAVDDVATEPAARPDDRPVPLTGDVEGAEDLAPADFVEDVSQGFHRAPMSVRVSPYVLSLIDWADPYRDPLRTQFIPVGSRMLPNHPKVGLDSLHEQDDAPVSGLTHRYRDKALFLTLDTCPVYCRFCTRSYAVGLDTDEVHKVSLKTHSDRWDKVFRYVASRPELEDIVISGGDSYNLRAAQIRQIAETLLDMPNILRIRFATKGPAVMPQKILTDEDWMRELTWAVDYGRKKHKEVVVHTHFNHCGGHHYLRFFFQKPLHFIVLHICFHLPVYHTYLVTRKIPANAFISIFQILVIQRFRFLNQMVNNIGLSSFFNLFLYKSPNRQS